MYFLNKQFNFKQNQLFGNSFLAILYKQTQIIAAGSFVFDVKIS